MSPPSLPRRRLLAAVGAGAASALAGCGSRPDSPARAYDARALRDVREMAVPAVPTPAPVTYPASYVRERA